MAVVVSAGNKFVLENEFVTVNVDINGRISSLFDKKEKREIIVPGELGNRFKMYEDIVRA